MKTTPGKTTTDRTERLRRQVLSPDRHVAAFDLENTLIASNVVESYSWLATRRLDRGERVRYALRTLAEAPGLLKLDRIDRGDFLRHFYRRYEDAPVDQIEADADELLTQLILTKSFPAGCGGCASTARSATARSSSPAPSTSPSRGCGRCSTRSSPPR